MKTQLQACFVNTEQEPLKVEHICFYTQKDGEEIWIMAVQKLTYPHPSTDMATIEILSTRFVSKRSINEFEAAPYMILHYAQQNAHKAR